MLSYDGFRGKQLWLGWSEGQSYQMKLFYIPGTWLILGSPQGQVFREHAQ